MVRRSEMTDKSISRNRFCVVGIRARGESPHVTSETTLVHRIRYPARLAMADYAGLQKLALSEKGQDEAVTVNQRALIGSFAVIRCILTSRQNPCSICLGQHHIARTTSKCGRRERYTRQDSLHDFVTYPCGIRVAE